MSVSTGYSPPITSAGRPCSEKLRITSTVRSLAADPLRA